LPLKSAVGSTMSHDIISLNSELDEASPQDELELAYQRALAAVEAIESALPGELLADREAHASEADPSQPPTSVPELRLVTGDPDSETGDPAAQDTEAPSPATRLTPQQVVEALLFVGGDPLTARKLCSLLRDDSDHEFVDRTIEMLNARYAAQGRPYLIRLMEGGYRMELRAEFEGVRSRVFGYGPKEVRLSQDTVETLAVVAYRQPVSRKQVEQILERSAGAVLNQLLRRELIALERGEETGEVTYRTTPRFLELFGLGGIQELPQADELSFK
jgi:segregation and condensation protein B